MSYEECYLGKKIIPIVSDESNMVKIFKLNLNENKTKIEDFEKISSQNALNQVKLYCQKLRVDVQAATDQRIEAINQLNSNMIEKIDQYENRLLQDISRLDLKLNYQLIF